MIMSLPALNLFGLLPKSVTNTFALAGIEHLHFARLRGVYVRTSKPEIVVRTRTGGGNRESYDEAIDACCAAESFLREKDCSYDRTYMKFYYAIQDEYKDAWKTWQKAQQQAQNHQA